MDTIKNISVVVELVEITEKKIEEQAQIELALLLLQNLIRNDIAQYLFE